jgi:geranylgeranyl diphosphate synthase type I
MPTGVPAADAPVEPRDRAGLADLNRRVTAALAAFLDRADPALDAVGPELAPVAAAIREFVLAGGKRLRPAFCYWGWRGAGRPDSDALVNAAASLELLHACALIHDDVMDGSDTRRGRPAVHRHFAQLHRVGGWTGSPDAFGASAAILLGDLCLVWADQMLGECGLEAAAIARAGGVYAEMRVELMAGQFLDVLASVLGGSNGPEATERALRVARYKSAKYTVERPLHLGGVLAGAPAELLAAYSAYGLPLGEAFQLRDDVLGVYGDPAITGKPAGDDLREGKRTALVTLAEQRATPGQAAALERLIGDPGLDAAGVDTCRAVIRESGALREVEQLIERRGAQARRAATEPVIDEQARPALEALAAAATDRMG